MPLERLAAALADLEEQGVLTPCQHGAGALWLSDDYLERREAAALCKACPVIDVCAAGAEVAGLSGGPATFGVWAGRDRTRQPGKKNPTTAKENAS